MFGIMYPIFEHETRTNDRVRNRELHDYLRWEYGPADRTSVILSVRGGAIVGRRSRTGPRPRTLVRRLRAWAKALRAPTDASVVAAERPARD